MPLTIRQQICPDDFVRQLIADIQAMPKRIADAKDALASAEFEMSVDNAVDRAKERMKDVESEAAFIVAGEVNGDGKKRHANEAQREAAARTMLSKDPEYLEARNQIILAERHKAELTMHVGKLRIQLAYLIDCSYANKGIAEMVAGLAQEDHTYGKLEMIARKESILSNTLEELQTT